MLTGAQLASLLALPASEPDLVRHWTLDRADLVAVERRRGDHNRLGFALQLCACRYPGRLLRPGEAIPKAALRFVAEGVCADATALADYARRPQTRREQLGALRDAFGFRMFGPGHRQEIAAWLLPVALATTDAAAIAAALMDELRRRRILAPGPSVLERLVATALLAAERHVAARLTRGLTAAQVAALEGLLGQRRGNAVSTLAWARQPPGAPGHRALARLVEGLECFRAVGLNPALAGGIHPARLRGLAREDGRLTAQHLRALSPVRRRVVLVATVLDTVVRLTDDGVALFDRTVGRMFRRAEAREEEGVLRDARAVNDNVRLLARLGAALIAARDSKGDLEAAVADTVGWDRLARGVAEAERLVRPDGANLPALYGMLPAVRVCGGTPSSRRREVLPGREGRGAEPAAQPVPVALGILPDEAVSLINPNAGTGGTGPRRWRNVPRAEGPRPVAAAWKFSSARDQAGLSAECSWSGAA
ncbi:hypothetical protein GCM10011504_51360 [Siccirubricoccus deserti]|nr:hypothetical protein GCM10011504_51360 [Siccirubricoccus deserti]